MFILRNDCEYYKIPNSVNRFPDGTLAAGGVPNYYNEILWLYEGDEEFFTLLCLREHMVEKVGLIMPYIPHARMDRVENGEIFTLKTFCKAINSMNFSEVVVADPHSNVSTALLDRVKVISPKKFIGEAIDCVSNWKNSTEDVVLFFPDEGAMKRYSKMFPDARYTFGIKDRDWTTGKIMGHSVINGELVKDRDILIVDDICSRGGTFFHASKALKAAGAKSIHLYVTHCESTIFDGDMYTDSLVEKVYTTDSILSSDRGKVQIIYSFSEDFRNGKVL